MNPAEIERISSAATRSCHEAVVAVDWELVRQKAADARSSPRRREIHVFHSGDHEVLQRMLNALQPGSYVAPHRHAKPPKAESIVLLQGSLAFVAFLDDGTPDEKHFVHLSRTEGRLALDLRAGVWHTFFALERDTVVFEVKPGPYDPTTDKDFAAWAPKENDPASPAYLARLEDRFRSHHGLPPREWNVAD